MKKIIAVLLVMMLGFSVMGTTNNEVAAASYKLKSGKLVDAKTNKVVNGKATYKSKVYYDGKIVKGLLEGTYYTSGKADKKKTKAALKKTLQTVKLPSDPSKISSSTKITISGKKYSVAERTYNSTKARVLELSDVWDLYPIVHMAKSASTNAKLTATELGRYHYTLQSELNALKDDEVIVKENKLARDLSSLWSETHSTIILKKNETKKTGLTKKIRSLVGTKAKISIKFLIGSTKDQNSANFVEVTVREGSTAVTRNFIISFFGSETAYNDSIKKQIQDVRKKMQFKKENGADILVTKELKYRKGITDINSTKYIDVEEYMFNDLKEAYTNAPKIIASKTATTAELKALYDKLSRVNSLYNSYATHNTVMENFKLSESIIDTIPVINNGTKRTATIRKNWVKEVQKVVGNDVTVTAKISYRDTRRAQIDVTLKKGSIKYTSTVVVPELTKAAYDNYMQTFFKLIKAGKAADYAYQHFLGIYYRNESFETRNQKLADALKKNKNTLTRAQMIQIINVNGK